MARKSRKRKTRREGPHIFWRRGRAYADLRAYADVGGGKVALAEPGGTWGTTDPDVAQVLFATRLAELEAKRKGRVGVPIQRTTTLAELVEYHLATKEKAGKTSDSHLADLATRLRVAIEYFGAERDPRTIEADEVREWSDKLADGGRRRPGTVRHYLMALQGLYRRAIEGNYVAPNYNPVAALVEKPSITRTSEARFYTVPEAALILEGARILDEREAGHVGDEGNRATAAPGLYPLVATLLLTGGRWSEVRGLDVDDVSFDRKLVRFRPNAHRGLKTSTSKRTVPLWPQLEEILRAWLFGGAQPRTSGLLFPSLTGGMVGDIRKSLDAIGALIGLEAEEVRTRPMRHTYCSARLQTVERIVRPGRDPSDPNAWDYVEVTRDRVAREMGHGGTKLVERVYGHAPRTPNRSEVVEYCVANHRDELGERLRALELAR